MIQSFLRRMPFQHVTSIVFLLVTAAVLAAGLGQVVRGARLTVFVPVGVVAALVSWGLGSRRFNGGWVWVGMVLGGAGWLWASTAQFDGPLLQMAASIPSIAQQVFNWYWDREVIVDFSAAISAWQNLLTQSAGLWQRITLWGQGLQSGENRYDPVIYVLLWSFLLWLVVAWSGWFMRREHILTATIPSLALLAEVLYVTNADITPLWIMLAITLLLMGLTYFRSIFSGWLARGVDYAEIIFDSTISFILIIVMLLAAAAWMTPSISVKQIADAIREHTTPAKPGKSLAETLGLQTTTNKQGPFDSIKKSALPDSHFIKGGPELSRDLVMTISTGELPPARTFELVRLAPYHRWRSYTLDRYMNTGWANMPVDNISYPANEPIFAQIPSKYRILRQTVRVAEKSSGKLYWDGVLLSVDQPFEASWRSKPQPNAPVSDIPFNGADMLGALSPAMIYQVTSLIPTMEAEQLQAAPGTYSEAMRQRYLTLPDNLPERVLALARQITATAPTPYDQAQALEAYLRKNYPYNLNIPAPPADRDVVDYFLFDLKKGFCDYYATSMVVMARSVGLPARIVFGYSSGSYDPTTATYNIVKADAHAWVEVYFPKAGWVEFDPTANQPQINRPLQSEASENAGPVNPPGSFGALMTMLQNSAPNFVIWGGLGAAGLLLFIVLFQIAEFVLLANIHPIRAMQIIYRSLYRSGRNITGPTYVGETADEFAAALRAHLQSAGHKKGLQKPFAAATRELNLLTELYQRAIYTPHAPEKREIIRALHAWQALRWRLFFVTIFPNRKSKIASSHV